MKELTIDTELENLQLVNDFVDAELEGLDCPVETRIQIHIAIDEIFGNIVHYAYGEGNGSVSVRFEAEEEPERKVILSFLDEGIPFDPLKMKAPDTTLKARERKIGGLGIFMVKKLMDEVTYEYIDGKNVLKIKKML